jgi:hypothetical protein
MKLLTKTLSLILIFSSVEAHACPDISGKYWCLIDDGHRESWLDVLTVEEETDLNSSQLTNFKIKYRSVPDGVITFSANDIGFPNDNGWMTKCTEDKVISLRNDYSAISEIYLDKNDNLITTFNYKVVQSCSRKKN